VPRGQCDGFLRPYFLFSRPEPLLFSLKYILSCTHEAEWTLFQTHYFSEDLSAGNRSRASGSVARNSDHSTTEAVFSWSPPDLHSSTILTYFTSQTILEVSQAISCDQSKVSTCTLLLSGRAEEVCNKGCPFLFPTANWLWLTFTYLSLYVPVIKRANQKRNAEYCKLTESWTEVITQLLHGVKGFLRS
jgi:hypothetical protein